MSGGLCCAVTARDAVYAIGRGGWDLELFGGEATILRARPSNGSAGLLLSCAGGDRRLRLTLPGAFGPELGHARAGRILIRAGGGAAMARVTVQGTALALADRRIVDAVLTDLRASVTAPRRLDLLLHLGSGPVVLGRLTALHLSLSSTPSDGFAFMDASTACETDMPAAAPASPKR